MQRKLAIVLALLALAGTAPLLIGLLHDKRRR